MGTAENLLTEMKAKAREITGGTRGLTNDELLALAKEYKIDPKYLFDDQTNATMKYFAGKNFSGDYQARVAMEKPVPISSSLLGNGGSFSLMSPLEAADPKDAEAIRAQNRVIRDEFNKREYFYMDGVKYVRVQYPKGIVYEAIIDGKTRRFQLTENGVTQWDARTGNKGPWTRTDNGAFDPDGQLSSGAQEWWNIGWSKAKQYGAAYAAWAEDYVNGLGGGQNSPKLMTPAERAAFINSNAEALKISPDILYAIMAVEGEPYDNEGRPILHFEAGRFDPVDAKGNRKYADSLKYNAAAPWLDQEWFNGEEWIKIHPRMSPAAKNGIEHQVLNWAAGQEGDRAYQVTSMGAGQVLGEYHIALGYETAKDMYDAFQASEKAQHQGMFDFLTKVKGARMLEAMQTENLEAISGYYNGFGKSPAQIAQRALYTQKLRNALNAIRNRR
jgi:hypothetical protein